GTLTGRGDGSCPPRPLSARRGRRMNRFLLAVCVLLATVVAAGAQPPTVPFGQGTHAFRRILHDLNFKPLRDVKEITDPSHTLLIVLGETDPLSDLPGGGRGFMEKGGAVLIATDRSIRD